MKVTPIFSDIDADLRNDPRWYVSPAGKPHSMYAKRTIRNPNAPPRQCLEYAHRLVLERIIGRSLVRGEVCDHANHDTLDNRRENLRLVNNRQNSENRKPYPSRGVCFHKQLGKWQAQAGRRGQKAYIGIFDTFEEASRAARDKRKQLKFLGDEA